VGGSSPFGGKMMIKVKRIYEPWEAKDGFRILVDRLWPRGMSKERAKVDLWERDIAPSPRLKEWYKHDLRKWEEFQKLYQEELKGKGDLLNKIRELEREKGRITLLFSAKDEIHNSAQVLLKVLMNDKS